MDVIQQLIPGIILKQYFDEALKLENEGQYEKAEERYQFISTNSLMQGEYGLFVKSNIQLLYMYINLMHYHKLHSLIEYAQPYINKYGSDDDLIKFKFVKALFHGILGVGTPEEDLKELLVQALQIGDMDHIFNAVNNILHIYNSRGDYDESYQFIVQTEPLIDFENTKGKIGPFMYRVNKFDVLYELGHIDSAKSVIHYMEKDDHYLKVGSFEQSYWYIKAIIEEHYHSFDQACIYFEKALQINTEKYYFLRELRTWITILKKRELYQEVLRYQTMMIEATTERIELLESSQRVKIIEQLATTNLQQQMYLDRLTATKNRAFYEEELAKKRQYMNYTLAVFDIDKFKSINDNYGHLVGDQAIKFIASFVTKNIDQHDIEFIRYGGDEFIILLPYSKNKVHHKLQQIQQNIANKDFVIHDTGQKINITVSMGVAYTEHQPASLKALFKIADEALYKAKVNGRNQIHFQKYKAIL